MIKLYTSRYSAKDAISASGLAPVGMSVGIRAALWQHNCMRYSSGSTTTHLREAEAMGDTKDKVKDAIDEGAKKGKEATEKVAEKTKDAAKSVGETVKDAGKKIKDMGK